MSDDDMSEYDDDWDDDDNSIWQDMTNETVHIDERKASTNSTSSEVSAGLLIKILARAKGGGISAGFTRKSGH